VLVSCALCGAAPAQTPDSSWSLEQLVRLAAEQQPELAAARARAEAARGRLLQAGLYPNPVVSWITDDLGDRRSAAGQSGGNVTQQIVTAGKLWLAQAAAAQGVAAADWQAVTRWYDVLTRVRLAYYEVLTARREVQTAEDVVKLAQEGLDAAEKLQKAGAGTQPDVLRARVELEQSRIRLRVARQRLEAAGKLLGVAVGVPDLAPRPLEGDLEAAAPTYDWPPLVETVLTRSSEVQEAQAVVFQAEGQVRLARAQRVPNVTVSLNPYYHFPEQTMQAQIQVGGPLPLFDRNQGNIRAAEAEAARARAEARQVELRLLERLTASYQRYESARQQAEAYQKQILPHARESLRLVRLGYERGDPKYDYTALLQAQQTLVQARLAYVQARGELWRAVWEIKGLAQEP
jgi:cobalt-zinc-cadmium efflux system outer membrane protein